MAQQPNYGALSSPSDYTLELADIERRKKLAAALQQQGMEGVGNTEMVGGWAIPKSPLEGIGKAAQQLSGSYQQGQLLRQEKEIAGKQKTEENQANARLYAAALGTTPNFAQDPTRIATVQPQWATDAQPDLVQKPPSAEEKKAMMLSALLQHPNPAMRAQAVTAMVQPLTQNPESAFAKIDPSKFTPESVSKFASTNKHADLVPRDKLDFHNIGGNLVGLNSYTGAKTTDMATTLKPSDAADIAWKQYAFNNLSANQKAQLQNEAARIGISAQDLYFNTGQQGGGAFKVPQGQNAPFVMPGANPATQGVPAASQQGQPTPVAAPQQPQPVPVRASQAQPIPVAAPQPMAQPVAQPSPMPQGGQAPLVLPPKARVAIEQSRQENLNNMENKRTFNMAGINDTIGEARKILTGGGGALPTSSGAGSLVDSAAGFVGMTPRGAPQADQLRALGGALTSKVPRMEGPQSDKDVQLYREMAGQIGNDGLPIKRRLAALDEVERLYAKYEHLNRGEGGGVAGAVPLTGITERRAEPRSGSRIVVPY